MAKTVGACPQWWSEDMVQCKEGGTIVDQAKAEFQKILDDYPYAHLSPRVWKELDIDLVDSPYKRFREKMHSILPKDTKDFMSCFRQVRAVGDMAGDMDLGIVEHNMHQVTAAMCLSGDVAETATLGVDVAVEGAAAAALIGICANMYFDHVGRKMQDVQLQRWQATLDGAIAGGMVMSGSVEAGSAVSELCTGEMWQHGIVGGVAMAIGGVVASGMTAKDHWNKRHSRLEACEVFETEFMNSFPKGSRHHAFVSSQDDDNMFNYLLNQLSPLIKQFDDGAAERLKARKKVLRTHSWDSNECNSEDFRVQHCRFQVGENSYVWFLPPATGMNQTKADTYISRAGLEHFDGVFFTVTQNQKEPDPGQAILMAKLECKKVTTIFVKGEDDDEDPEYYLGVKGRWSSPLDPVKTNVVIVGSEKMEALPGGELLTHLLKGPGQAA